MFSKAVYKLSKNDLTVKSSIIILILMVGVYTLVSVATFESERKECEYYGYHDTGTHTGLCGDYLKRQKALESFQNGDFFDIRHFLTYSVIIHVDNLTNDNSRLVFFLPMSILLLFTVYFFTKEITKVNYAGLIVVFLIIISPIFNKYDTSTTFPVYWVTFLFISLYLAVRPRIFGSSVCFAVSLFAKTYNILMLPVYLLLLTRTEQTRKKKFIELGILSGLLGVITYVGIVVYPWVMQGQFNLDIESLMWWLGMWTIEFKNDRLSLFIFVMTLISMALLSKSGVKNSKTVLFSMVVLMFQPAFVQGFTEFTNEEYRMLPMIIFGFVGFSMVISNLDKLIYEMQRFNTMFAK